ncbi:hypothetical protein BT96DRAFT_955932 [Gymnopus androsaceus JB14]|uniref:CxC2-like cysteine cluster KDZ transposase-associated domain-containing protein n=1 Tax=Gymnopus androsaceus JB14 TaxID=1447944 RepID=A0A6A4HWK7_9AGAR|nr:hypothetical protein BT96DRAFT_955932 [Gymnopus androsaceus JB14]
MAYITWRSQLLRWQWYPATHLEPQTAATFDVLNHLHVLTLQGKVTTYEQGRGNDSHETVAETKSGELAVECIACPKPGVNLPDDWEVVDRKLFFKYFLYLAEDCCFRLKHRLVSSEAKDPGLSTGSSFFMSTCTGLAALDHANTKYSWGYATTGVGLLVCARHEFVMPNSVVDLQKGERTYIDMQTWITPFGSLLRYVDPQLTVVQSYDISMSVRMKFMPVLVKENFPLKKLMDGEGIERGWAHMGPVATSTRDMGPGNRHEVLDDHFMHWNWRKLTGLGILLRKCMCEAVAQAEIHRFVQVTK